MSEPLTPDERASVNEFYLTQGQETPTPRTDAAYKRGSRMDSQKSPSQCGSYHALEEVLSEARTLERELAQAESGYTDLAIKHRQVQVAIATLRAERDEARLKLLGVSADAIIESNNTWFQGQLLKLVEERDAARARVQELENDIRQIPST